MILTASTMEPFNAPPTVPLLQTLARVPLGQNLIKPIRLWAWLTLLYGENDLGLPREFTLAQWRDRFFTPTHPRSDAIPHNHDPRCPCQRTVAQWIELELPHGLAAWGEQLRQTGQITDEMVEGCLQRKLFAVTRRSLATDLKDLEKLGCLTLKGRIYHCVADLPPAIAQHDGSVVDRLNFPVMNEDLKAIAYNLSEPLQGCKRFFLEVDYIVPKHALDRVEDWQAQLKEIWQQDPIPPVRLTYNSARRRKVLYPVVYPICIYYVRRSVYLCTYGESTNKERQWCNYRLDRVQKITELTWDDPNIPDFLYKAYRNHTLTHPDYIAVECEKAWGFDFYQPAAVMILRFEPKFAAGYIHNSDRHATFKPIAYEEITTFLTGCGYEQSDAKTMAEILNKRSPQDAYYRAYYRVDDVNVIQRLRAWRPKVEILWPPDLRKRMCKEVEEERQFYQDNYDANGSV